MLNYTMRIPAIHDAPPAQPAQRDLEAAQQPPANPVVLALPAALQNLPARARASINKRHIAETALVAATTTAVLSTVVTFALGAEGDPSWKPLLAIEMAAFGIVGVAKVYLTHLDLRVVNPSLAATCPPSPQEGAPHDAAPQHQSPA